MELTASRRTAWIFHDFNVSFRYHTRSCSQQLILFSLGVMSLALCVAAETIRHRFGRDARDSTRWRLSLLFLQPKAKSRGTCTRSRRSDTQNSGWSRSSWLNRAGFAAPSSASFTLLLRSTLRSLSLRGMSTLASKSLADAVDVSCTADELVVTLADGRKVSAPLEWFPRLLRATPAQRAKWRLIGRGVGIHWDDVDEDISVRSLLAS
jgi:Protein of unknown function (DUF2442)